MTETVIKTKAFPAILTKLITTERICVQEKDGIIQLIPVRDDIDCTAGLRGVLADYNDMSVDMFLERKHAEKRLDL